MTTEEKKQVYDEIIIAVRKSQIPLEDLREKLSNFKKELDVEVKKSKEHKKLYDKVPEHFPEIFYDMAQGVIEEHALISRLLKDIDNVKITLDSINDCKERINLPECKANKFFPDISLRTYVR